MISFGLRGRGWWGGAGRLLLLLVAFLSGISGASGQPLSEPGPARVVLIDPGHGGTDSGLVGALGIREKDVALTFSRILQGMIQDRWGARVLLTRVSDVSVPDRLRVAEANNERASLFLSIHLGSSGSKEEGLRLLYPDFSAPQRGAGKPAAARGGGRLLLWDYLPDAETLAASQRLALETGQLLEENHVPLLGVHGVPLAGFRGLTSPGFLIELGQVPNAEEERRLQDGKYLQKISQALVSALEKSWWAPGQKKM